LTGGDDGGPDPFGMCRSRPGADQRLERRGRRSASSITFVRITVPALSGSSGSPSACANSGRPSLSHSGKAISSSGGGSTSAIRTLMVLVGNEPNNSTEMNRPASGSHETRLAPLLTESRTSSSQSSSRRCSVIGQVLRQGRLRHGRPLRKCRTRSARARAGEQRPEQYRAAERYRMVRDRAVRRARRTGTALSAWFVRWHSLIRNGYDGEDK
jgi:hypothetical protein